MASAAVLWFGEPMSAVPLRNNKAVASDRAQRHGAGRDRVDRRQHDGFAARRARPLPGRGADGQQQCRRRWQNSPGNSTRALRRSPIPRGFRELKDALAGTANRMRRRRKRDHRGGGAAGRLGDGRRQRRGRAEAGACGRRSRRGGGARQQGMPRLRRRFLHAARGEGGRLHPAGRFRAQCAVPGLGLRQPRRTGARDHHRLGRAVPHLGRRRHRAGDAGAGAEASELEHGPEDHDRSRPR